jgi:hypothetical protein
VGAGTPAASQRWRTSSSSSEGQPWTCPIARASGSGTRPSLQIRPLFLPRLVGGRHHLQPRGSLEPHPQPGPVPAGCRSRHRQLAVLQGDDGRGKQPQHHVCAYPASDGDRGGTATAQHNVVPWCRARQARPAPRANRSAGLVWHTGQFP